MEAYVARRRKKNGKNKILVAFVFLLIIASGIILYKFYEKIEVEELDKGSEAVRTLRTLDEEKEEQKEPGQDDNNQDENNKPGNNKPGDNKPGNNKPGAGNKNESINKNNKPLVNTGSEAYIIILVSALVMVAVGVKIIKRKSCK